MASPSASAPSRHQAAWHSLDSMDLSEDARHRFEALAARQASGPGAWGLLVGPASQTWRAAEVVAKHLGQSLHRVHLSQVVSKYIGETEKNLRRVFDAAEASGAILFFDEADALFGKRTDVGDSHDRYAALDVGFLLQRVEEHRNLVFFAAQTEGPLDQDVLKRAPAVVECRPRRRKKPRED